MRRFGFVHVLPTIAVAELPFLMTLGKEPLKDLTFSDFESLLKNSNRPIKNLLLDQHKIAGIGNIYACEALWIAQVNPQRAGNRLKKNQIKKLFSAIEAVLQEGLQRGGASDNSYRNLLGGKGEYQNFFKVYGQTGKPCQRCGTKIERITLAGRGTFFCPHCQK
jgi:formamidopyrimidine-DNA glycosylase